jgi:hypothetical protein
MALYTVEINGGAAVEVYAGLDKVDAYLNNSSSKGAIAYRALTAGSDDRKRLIVDATRMVDRHRWQGTANGLDGTTLAFPRDDIELEGAAASDADQLALVEDAVAELVAILAVKSSTYSQADTGSNIKAAGAGKARVEFFGPTRTKDGSATKLPTVVHDLIGMWLASQSPGAVGSIGGASSSSSESNFNPCSIKPREPF